MSRFVRSKWAQFLVMLVALEIIAISINMFYAPHNIASGGATGIGILLEAAFGFNLSLVVLIINIFMLILAWIFLSKQTVLKIALGSFILPVCLALTRDRGRVDFRGGHLNALPNRRFQWRNHSATTDHQEILGAENIHLLTADRRGDLPVERVRRRLRSDGPGGDVADPDHDRDEFH